MAQHHQRFVDRTPDPGSEPRPTEVVPLELVDEACVRVPACAFAAADAVPTAGVSVGVCFDAWLLPADECERALRAACRACQALCDAPDAPDNRAVANVVFQLLRAGRILSPGLVARNAPAHGQANAVVDSPALVAQRWWAATAQCPDGAPGDAVLSLLRLAACERPAVFLAAVAAVADAGHPRDARLVAMAGAADDPSACPPFAAAAARAVQRELAQRFDFAALIRAAVPFPSRAPQDPPPWFELTRCVSAAHCAGALLAPWSSGPTATCAAGPAAFADAAALVRLALAGCEPGAAVLVVDVASPWGCVARAAREAEGARALFAPAAHVPPDAPPGFDLWREPTAAAWVCVLALWDGGLRSDAECDTWIRAALRLAPGLATAVVVGESSVRTERFGAR